MKALALHGFLGDHHDWDAFRDSLPTGFEIMAPDLPGHGPRPSAVPDDFGGWTAWVHDLLSAQDEPVHLLGYSMGGRLALSAALADPRYVASLTLLSASPGLATTEERVARLESDTQRAQTLEQHGLEAFLHHWYQLPLFAPLVESRGLHTLVERRRHGHASSLAQALRTGSTGTMPDCRSLLPDLQIPVLTLAGEQDSKYLQLEQDIAAAALHGFFAVLPGAGHALLLEAPHACARRWSAFIKQLHPERSRP